MTFNFAIWLCGHQQAEQGQWYGNKCDCIAIHFDKPEGCIHPS